jgi:nucleotide-binding universal stress UspA family protein
MSDTKKPNGPSQEPKQAPRNPRPIGLVETGAHREDGASPLPEVKRKILVVAKDQAFSIGVLDYAANLAGRLGYDIMALNVNPALEAGGKVFSPYNRHLQEKFRRQAQASLEQVRPRLTSQGIHCDQVVKFEGVAQAVMELSHLIKRIDFVITDAGIADEEITGEIPLPVFSISGNQGEKVMAKLTEPRDWGRVRAIGKTVALGAAAAGLYAAVFLNSGTIMRYFTRGGWYAALPIATVFIFSFVHGAFASNVWSLLGIEATKKVQPRVAPTRPAQRKRPRPQLRIDT